MASVVDVIDLLDSDDDDEPVVVVSGVANRNNNRGDLEHDDDEVEIVENASARPRGRKRSLGDPPGRAENLSTAKGDSNNNGKKTRKTPPATSVRPQTPLEHVLELFPDVSLEHARKLLKEHNNVHANVIEALLAGSYPKEKPVGVGGMVKRTEVEPTYDFMSSSSFDPTPEYINQSASYLVQVFPILTKAGAKMMLQKTSNHYAIAHSKLVSAITGKDEGGKAYAASMGTGASDDPEVLQLEKFKCISTRGEALDNEQKKRLETVFGIRGFTAKKGNLSVQRKRSSTSITDPILLEEAAWVNQRIQTWMDKVDTSMNRKAARVIAVKDGSAVTCDCCFDQYAIEEMAQCQDGHLFCIDCLESYVVNQVFSNGSFGFKPNTKEQALELSCFHGDGCSFGFERWFLEKALAPKVLQKYDELQSKISLSQAGLGDAICTCPKCGFSAEVPAEQNIFMCQMEDCGYESCRHCREASHIPLRCDEVEKKAEAEGRARVEEAASNAVIRFCPKCKKGIVKSDGCNKMTCACGIKFCYMCRTIVKDYKHFCQTPHCTHQSCKICPLWTKDLDAEHEKAMREAAVAEAAKVEAESATSKVSQEAKVAGLFGDEDARKQRADKTKVHIDVDSILQAPNKKRRAA